MVDLVLVLVVAVMAGARAQVRQRLAVLDKALAPLGPADAAVAAFVKEGQNRRCYGCALLGCQVVVGRVVEAVGAFDLGRRPEAVAVKVVQGEEGVAVKVGNVVFL